MIVQENPVQERAVSGRDPECEPRKSDLPVARFPSSRRIWALAGTLLAIGTAILLLRGGKTTPYRTATLDQGNIESSISATGIPNAVKDVLVGSQVSGNISELFVDFNSKVTRGQVIARIDPQNFEAQVAMLKRLSRAHRQK